MRKNLVIVESPAKAKTIERFLGKEYKVTSSYGHVRDLKKREISIDPHTLEPDYEIPDEKKALVESLRRMAKDSANIWLASDEDREGEAISWHLCEVLGLDREQTKRIVFHEITKTAILSAIEHSRTIDMNLVNAQQARRVLDRIVGFKLSPVLWRKVKPALSAGRVQSVAVRLIVEREREIQQFKSDRYYRVTALFSIPNGDDSNQVRAELNTRFKTAEEAQHFLESCKEAAFTVNSVQTKPQQRVPAPPFTTSTLQQEAARKLGFTVSQTMMIAQHLYESGLITYMRTDSVNLSSLCLAACHNEIANLYGEEYCKTRKYRTHSKGAQEAHEAIRPSYMNRHTIDGNTQEKRLYELIWKRTLACQMADAEMEKTTANISIAPDEDNPSQTLQEMFVATGETVKFDGFLKVYRESTDDEENTEDTHDILPELKKNIPLQSKEIVTTERFLQPPLRYTEASLVKKMEELGIGRPSTYAPTISTIQQRDYVIKGDDKGTEHTYTITTLKNKKISTRTKKEIVGKEKGKLIPTDIGLVVNDFLMEHFPTIMDYNFTAKVEEEFDKIADGKTSWLKMMQRFDKDFEPTVDRVMSERTEHKAGEREIGTDPVSGKPVFVKIGRFGPVAQIGNATDSEKPRFAQLPSDKSIDLITLEEALELFKLPRVLGEYEGKSVVIGTGRFGPYVQHNKQYISLPKEEDPMAVTLETAVQLIEERRQEQQQRHLRTFSEEKGLEIMNGQFGPYIAYKGTNYRLPKKYHSKIQALTYEECKQIIQEAIDKKKK
mgnify:CR=1 FL=1